MLTMIVSGINSVCDKLGSECSWYHSCNCSTGLKLYKYGEIVKGDKMVECVNELIVLHDEV